MEIEYRQGDVFLIKVDKLPAQARLSPPKPRIILAYGEATGHTHAVSGLLASLHCTEREDYLVVDTLAQLVHEEHDTISVPKGTYRVVRQREYDPDGSQ